MFVVINFCELAGLENELQIVCMMSTHVPSTSLPKFNFVVLFTTTKTAKFFTPGIFDCTVAINKKFCSGSLIKSENLQIKTPDR